MFSLVTMSHGTKQLCTSMHTTTSESFSSHPRVGLHHVSPCHVLSAGLANATAVMEAQAGVCNVNYKDAQSEAAAVASSSGASTRRMSVQKLKRQFVRLKKASASLQHFSVEASPRLVPHVSYLSWPRATHILIVSLAHPCRRHINCCRWSGNNASRPRKNAR